MDVVDRMRAIVEAQTYGPPDDGGEIVGPFQKTWVTALLDVAEAADEFWGGANDVMTTSHHDDIGDSYDALHAALVHLDALTERP